MTFARACGVLLHPTCLPGRFGIGDLGPAAHGYLEWLARAGARWWQVLPLHPAGLGASPYAATSTFAGNPLLVSPDALRAEGLLQTGDLADVPEFPPFAVDFSRVAPYKLALLERAFERFAAGPPAALGDRFAAFRAANGDWLRVWALFAAIKRSVHGLPWWEWPQELALRRPGAVAGWLSAHERAVRFEEFVQFLFFSQLHALRERASGLGVRILGDLPIYVARDSAEVWSNRDLFRLDARGWPLAVAGVPPDYFSPTGQLWGNPVYDWNAVAASGWAWWVERVQAALAMTDAVRLDHFRGFVAYWEVPFGETTAVKGRWVPGPGGRLFAALRRALGELPLVAEDLGVITEEVTELRDAEGLPGMAVLQFAFDPGRRSLFLPYRQRRNQVVYTGTHDNNTTLGWFLADASPAEKEFVRRYLATDGREIHWDMIRLALASVADLAIVPHQDIAGLGADCRMNTPSTPDGNWRFRLTDWMLGSALADRLADLAGVYGRTP